MNIKDVIDPASAKSYVGVAVSIGVLAGVWAEIADRAGYLTWVGFLAWACHYAAGASFKGFRLALLATVTGALWAWLAVKILGHLDFTLDLGVVVAVLAFVLCIQAMSPLLAFIPGAFVGAAAFFGAAYDVNQVLIALAIGAGFGYLSDLVARQIQAVVDHRPMPRPRMHRPAPVA